VPDYFVLPLLAGHFARRFGNIPWAIIDEKRRIVLSCDPGETPRLARLSEKELPAAGEYDGWEKLWRNYFRSAANESRLNPGLQKQFMPRRYWEYLSELGEEKV
jgi:probable DNA metabolism protein